ncbi:MAG: glucokinase [Pseudomonadota bacterium]
MILVADIGGTNARFAIAECGPNSISLHDPQSFRAEDFETVRDAADAYLESVSAKPNQACFAVAAPIESDDIAFTNSPWSFNRKSIQTDLAFEQFSVVNDFAALAAGIAAIPEDFVEPVRGGTAQKNAPKLVIGPGTGLGQALLVPCGREDRVISTQGGHVSFAPRSDLEIQVMQFIAREHPRVSVERLLCGRGLINIHRALCHIADTPRTSLQANEITQAARTREHPIAAQAVSFFCNLLGAVVGDAALSSGARGGIYLAGGILPKIKDIFHKSDFEAHFLSKGRMQSYLEPIPITLITKEGTALYGAAKSLKEPTA